MRQEVVAMVMVGGRGTRLGNITKKTAKPAVSFGGKYKLIDFVLSNLAHSDISTCGIITQYEPHELMQYIGTGSTWDLDVNEGGISFLTPYADKTGELWQKGTAHAIKQHFRYIEQYNPRYVVILGGDHIYKMNYQNMITEHIKKNADITISTFTVQSHPERFGILESDTTGKVISFEEKPQYPKSNQASMGIYVFSTPILKELLEVDEASNIDFGKDILPLALQQKKEVYSYRFNGYFQDVGTLKSLYKTNMDLIDKPHLLKLHEYVDFPVYTKSSNLPPHHIAEKAVIKNTLISDGSLVIGDVYHSVLSSGVIVHKGAVVRDSIIHSNVDIGVSCYLKNCIVVENTKIPGNSMLIFDEITVIDHEFLDQMEVDIDAE